MLRRTALRSSSLLDMVRSAVGSLIPESPESLLTPVAPVTLAAFDGGSGMEGWRVVTDGSSELQGASIAAVTIMTEAGGGDQTPTTFARFSGTLSKRMAGHKEQVRTGFAALRSDEWDPPKALSEMDVLELKLRSDGRTYAVNLNVDSFNHEDIYQGVVQAAPLSGGGEAEEAAALGEGEGSSSSSSSSSSSVSSTTATEPQWRTLTLPLHNFVLTRRGRESASQRMLDGDARIKSVGILLADHVDGPFQLDVASIVARSAVNDSINDSTE